MNEYTVIRIANMLYILQTDFVVRGDEIMASYSTQAECENYVDMFYSGYFN